MKSLKILALGISLLVMATNCKLSEQEIASGKPTTVASGITDPVTSSGASGGTTSLSDADVSGALIYDPLTNGASVGMAYGGTFTSAGYRLDSTVGSYLAYSTGITTGGIRVEFDATGYQTYEDGVKKVVIEIFDTSHDTSWAAGPVWETSSLCQVKKVDEKIRVKVGASGAWEDEYVGSFDWNGYMTYHWVINVQNGVLTVTRNGETVASKSSQFNPAGAALNVRIGGSWWDNGSAGVTYSNVVIYSL